MSRRIARHGSGGGASFTGLGSVRSPFLSMVGLLACFQLRASPQAVFVWARCRAVVVEGGILGRVDLRPRVKTVATSVSQVSCRQLIYALMRGGIR